MSDRDESTGQFAAEAPTAYGREGVEREAGYIPMPEEKDEQEELTVAEAAEMLSSQSHTAESDIQTHVMGVDLPDNMSMTLEQGQKALTDIYAADAAQAEKDEIARIQKETDELRGVKPEAEGDAKQPAQEAQPPKDGELDPEIERALNNPKIKEAIAAQISEAETVRQNYSKAVDMANTFARASFMENFPEISALPLEQWDGALAAMAQREPDRFGKAIGSLQRVVQLQAAQQERQQFKAFQERQQFQAYTKEQNARFAELVKDVQPTEMRAIEAEVPAMLKDYGADAKQFLEAISSQSVFPRAAAERIMVDAAKYRMLMKAPKAVAARQALPPVQRPGVSAPRMSGRDSDIAALDRQLTATGDINVAAKLYVAMSKARG